jgi:hypothetical protein
LDLLFIIRFNRLCIFLGKIKDYGHYTGVRWTMWLKILLNKIGQRGIDRRSVSWLGFFIDINLFKANNKKAAELSKDSNNSLEIIDGALDSSLSAKDGLTGEDSSLMVKLKFLNYKVLHCHCFQLLLELIGVLVAS